jgi:hypothetical protein
LHGDNDGSQDASVSGGGEASVEGTVVGGSSSLSGEGGVSAGKDNVAGAGSAAGGASQLVVVAAGAAVAAVVVAVAAIIVLRRRNRLRAQRRDIPQGSAASRFDTFDAGVFYESEARRSPDKGDNGNATEIFEI